MTLRIGIVGHRHLDLATTEFVSIESKRIFAQILRNTSRVIAVSAIAEGADTLFAEAAHAFGVPLEVVRPFDSYDSDFVDAASRRQYDRLRTHAQNEVQLNYKSRSLEAYEAAMTWVVMTSDLLLAAWDGRPANGPGGTGEAVEKALRLNRPWIHLNTSDLSTTRYLPKSK
jgi:hypothetical protein